MWLINNCITDYLHGLGVVVVIEYGHGGLRAPAVADAVQLSKDHRRAHTHSYHMMRGFGVRNESGHAASRGPVQQLRLEKALTVKNCLDIVGFYEDPTGCTKAALIELAC